jgi:hypothetical protein
MMRNGYLRKDLLFRGETWEKIALLCKHREMTHKDTMKRQHPRVLQLQHDTQGASEQKKSHLSPLSSVKQFVSKAFRLSHFNGEIATSPAEDDDPPTIAYQRHSFEPITQCYDPREIQTFRLLSHHEPGPSKATKATEPTLNMATLQRSPSFIEIKHWWKEEHKYICQENDLELNYLDEDSPLKGKSNALWRRKEPDLDLWKHSGGSVASLIYPERAVLQGRMMEQGILESEAGCQLQ